jgi:hypothetical protein
VNGERSERSLLPTEKKEASGGCYMVHIMPELSLSLFVCVRAEIMADVGDISIVELNGARGGISREEIGL